MMFDDPYKLVRDILLNDSEIIKMIPKANIRNAVIPESLKTQPPYIRISVLDLSDEAFADGEIRAEGLLVQIDIWQTNGLLTLGNRIKKLMKKNGFGYTDGLEPHTEVIADNFTLYRDARRYFYARELELNEIY